MFLGVFKVAENSNQTFVFRYCRFSAPSYQDMPSQLFKTILLIRAKKKLGNKPKPKNECYSNLDYNDSKTLKYMSFIKNIKFFKLSCLKFKLSFIKNIKFKKVIFW